MPQDSRRALSMFDRAAAELHLAALFGERKGFVALAYRLADPNDPSNREQDWKEQQFSWPSQKEYLLSTVETKVAHGCDVYVAPLLRARAARRKDSGQTGHVGWADADAPEAFDAALHGPLRRITLWVLESGSSGHHHVFLPFDADLSPDQIEVYNRRLDQLLGRGLKWSNESLLRLAGTANFKHVPPLPVRWRTAPNGQVNPLAWIDAVLPPDPGPGVNRSGPAGSLRPEPLPDCLPPWLVDLRDEEPDGDRSRQTFKLVCTSLHAGLSHGQTLTLAMQHTPSVEKYDTRLPLQVERVIGKWNAERAAELAQQLEEFDNMPNRGSEAAPLDDARPGWEPPTPLGRARLVLPAFPIDALPQWLGDYVRALATFTQTPPDLAGMLAIDVLAVPMGGRLRVQVRPGWQEPVNLYTAVAMRSGERKTAVVTDMSAPIRAYECELAQIMRDEVSKYQVELKLTKNRAEAALKAATKTKDSTGPEAEAYATARTLDKLEANPVVVPRLLADNATPEALASLLAQHDGRMAILSDEGGVFDLMAGLYSRSGIPNIDLYLKSHIGSTIVVDRKGRPSEHITSPALTVAVAVQPDVLRDLAANPVFRGRGLPARFLYALPRSLVGRRLPDPPAVPPRIAERYHTRLTSLLREFCGPRPLLRPPWPVTIELSDEARELLTRFRAQLEPRLGYGDLAHIADWASKLPGAATRIAGLLHVAENGTKASNPWGFEDCEDSEVRTPLGIYEHLVGAETMTNALQIADYLIEHALAVFDLLEADPKIAGARVVLEWVTSRPFPLEPFSHRDAHQALRSHFRESKDIKNPLKTLCEYHYLRQEKPETKGSGRPPSPRYHVNPLTPGSEANP